MYSNKSLLETITSKEVDDLIQEQELLDMNYRIHYFIDQVDIEKFVFPFGIIEGDKHDKREQRPIEIITDEQIAYDYLFNYRCEKLLLFDEHCVEIEGFQKKIEKIKFYGIKMVDSFKLQSEYFLKMRDGKTISFGDWSSNQKLTSELNVSLLISIALGSIRNGIENLNKLQEERIVISSEQYDSLGYITKSEAIIECKPNSITDKLFESLYESYSEPPQRRIAKYKKCKVYNRIIDINNHSVNNKELFFLLSSARSVNERLPAIASNLGFTIVINEKEINPIRTIGQLYLQLLLKDRNKISELEKIKEVILLKENNKSPNVQEMVNVLINKYFRDELINLREGYENVSLLLKIDHYKQMFRTAFKEDKIKNQKVIVDSIVELLKIAEKKDELEKLKSTNLIYLGYKRNYQLTLLEALNDVSFGNNYLYAFSGMDYVSNPYHTIPFVFFHGTEKFRIVMNNIVSLATDASMDNFSSKKLIEYINNSFDILFHKALPSEEESIVMIIILMMVGQKSNYNPDELANKWVDEILSVKDPADVWYYDFLYLKTWILRRLNQYPESIKISNEVISKNEDSRFFHSLYLNYYCQYQQNNNLSDLHNSLEACYKSYEKYQSVLNSENCLQKTISANLNSLAYLNTLVFISNDSNIENLTHARSFLNKLKTTDSSNFSNYSEFLHTEALLLLQEYIVSKDINKLNYALALIEKAIKIRPKKLYKELEEDIKNQLITAAKIQRG